MAAAADSHGGAGKESAPSIYADSFLQVRMWLWFKDNQDALKRDGNVTLPRIWPWSSQVLSDVPVLKEMLFFMDRYNINIDQVKRQLGLWADHADVASSELDISDAEALQDMLYRLGDIKSRAQAAVTRSTDPKTSLLCAPGARGARHYANTITEMFAECVAYCEEYIDTLVKLAVKHIANKAAVVAAKERKFTKERIVYDHGERRAASAVRLKPEPMMLPTLVHPDSGELKLAAWIGNAARKRMAHIASKADALRKDDIRVGAAMIAVELVDTAGASVIDQLIRDSCFVFKRGLTGHALDIVIEDRTYKFPPPESPEASTMYWIGGWVTFFVERCVMKKSRGAFVSAAARTTFDAASATTNMAGCDVSDGGPDEWDRSDRFKEFALEFCRRASYPRDDLHHVAQIHQLNMKKARERFELTGYDPVYATARMYRLINTLDAVLRSTLDDDTKLRYLGPATIASVQYALINSPVIEKLLLDVFREHPSNNMVRFGHVDRDTLSEDTFFSVFDVDDDELDRMLGRVELQAPKSYVRELLTIVVSAFVSMRGKDVADDISFGRTSEEVSATAVSFRGAIGLSGARSTVDGREPQPIQIRANIHPIAPISALDVSLDATRFAGVSAKHSLPQHRKDCSCGATHADTNYCKLSREWSCSECHLPGLTYFGASTCCLEATAHENKPLLTCVLADLASNS